MIVIRLQISGSFSSLGTKPWTEHLLRRVPPPAAWTGLVLWLWISTQCPRQGAPPACLVSRGIAPPSFPEPGRAHTCSTRRVVPDSWERQALPKSPPGGQITWLTLRNLECGRDCSSAQISGSMWFIFSLPPSSARLKEIVSPRLWAC